MLTMWDNAVIKYLANTLKIDGETNINKADINKILEVCNNRKDRLMLFKYAIENVLEEIDSENGKRLLEQIDKKLAQ